MIEQWLYGFEPDLTGDENMARDEAMARACAVDGVARLRLYTWSPYTLSLGYHQAESKIDVEKIRERGHGLVRRPTGGRAVFHAEEITYAVAMRSRDGIHETYGKISAAIARGLELAGATGIEFSRSQPDFRAHYSTDDSASCFSASALNELTWNGRKLVGSAQRRYDDVLLQHGSILLGPAHLEIVDLLRTSERANLAELRGRLAERTVALDAIIDPLPLVATIAAELRAGFEAVFAAELREVGAETLIHSSIHTEPTA